MSSRLFEGENISPEQREKYLEAHSVRKERTTFTQALTDEEIQIESAKFIRGNIDLGRMEADAKASADDWKGKIKNKENELEETLEMIKQGRREVTGILWHIPNQAKGEMLMCNKEGEVIEKRPLNENERQTRAFIDGPGGTIPNPDIEDIEHEDVEKAIDDLYAGPMIASDSIEDRFDDQPTRYSETKAFEDLPEGHVPGSAGFDYEQRSEEISSQNGTEPKKRGRKPKRKE